MTFKVNAQSAGITVSEVGPRNTNYGLSNNNRTFYVPCIPSSITFEQYIDCIRRALFPKLNTTQYRRPNINEHYNNRKIYNTQRHDKSC